MKTIALALATLSIASTPAMAGVYVNAESRDGYTGSEYTGRTVDLHVGYEGEVGKLGGKFDVTQKLGVYGEVSGISNEDADNTYGTKIGAKFKF